MITGLEYRISTTLSSLGLPHWIQYVTAPGREGIPGHLLTPRILHDWVIIQNQLVRLDQIEVTGLVSHLDGMPSHSLKLALHRLLLSKCSSDDSVTEYSQSLYWLKNTARFLCCINIQNI